MEQDAGSSPRRDETAVGTERLVLPRSDIEPVDATGDQQRRGSGNDQTNFSDRSCSAFSRLPSKVIEHILYIVDANSFASLALLNRKWRRVSDSPELYAYHLSRCPSFSLTRDIISGSVSVDDLPVLKGRFACEIRRNAFEVFLRPRTTLIKLISTSVSSSTAFPHGEAFSFSFSANGQMLLCLSSSRIFVVDLTSHPATVKHELKTPRKPLGATILDDGKLLAVISSKHQVNIYSLSNEEAKHVQAFTLNDVPRALALSPTGSVLAIAYDCGIEVYALGENAVAAERRAVRCVGVDSISFSSDGTILLGSSTDVNRTSVVSISAPFYTDSGTDATARDVQSRLWTTQILFPDIIPDYSHASLLPPHAEGGSWVIGYDKQIKAFRAVKINDARTGVTYFVGPGPDDGLEEPPPLTIPAADSLGELVVLGFQGSGLWLYGLPDRIDVAPLSSPTLEASGTQNSSQALIDRRWDGSSASGRDNSQRLQRTITQPSVLVTGHKVADIPGITAARWVLPPQSADDQGLLRHRLVAVAPGGVTSSELGGESVPIDGGRVLILDFERSTKNGEVKEITIEVGEAEPKMLREQNPSLDAEVELERRRTQLHRGVVESPRNPLSQRSASAARESFPAATGSSQKLLSSNQGGSHSQPSSPIDWEPSDNAHILDSPYSNTQPRSRDTLHRAATAAAASRGRYNPRYRGDTTEPQEQIPRIPHESDADDWVPPPPPYTREPDTPLPEEIRRLLLPSMTELVQRVGDVPPQVRRAHTSRLDSMARNAITRSRTVVERINTISSSRIPLGRRRTSRESSVRQSVRQSGRHRNVLQRRRETSAVNPASISGQVQTRTMQISMHPPGQDDLPSGVPTTTDNIPQVHSHSLQYTLPPVPVADEASSILTQAEPLMDGSLRSPTRASLQSTDITLQERTHLSSSLSQPQPDTRIQLHSDLSTNLPPSQSTAPQRANPERQSQYRTRPFASRLLSPRNQRGGQSSPAPARDVAHQPLSSDQIEESSTQSTGNRSLAGYHPFSMSSPDLHFHQSRINRLETIPRLRSRSGVRGVGGSRSRSQDIGSSMRPTDEAVPDSTATGRRIPTDPTGLRLPHDGQPEDWRERIEQCSVRTINERRRKGQGKCFVM